MISADDSPPCDRPNLSKDFLAGTAPDDWIPLRAPEFYAERRIDLVLNARVSALDVQQRRVVLENGTQRGYGALLIATGADPVRLAIPGATDAQVHYLRTFADSRAIVARAASARRVVVIGASFIGLEVAASLRARGIDVDVVAPDSVPLERVMGPEVGRFIRDVHESHGVTFHLGRTVSRVDGDEVTLSDATTLTADFIVVGVGVRPSIELAQRAGLAIDRGIKVDAYLETSAPGRVRRRRRRAVARSPLGRLAARRALGRRATPGSDGCTQHAGLPRAVRCRAVLLEPALRHRDQLCRARGKLGCRRDRRLARGARLHRHLQARRPDARRRHHRPATGRASTPSWRSSTNGA